MNRDLTTADDALSPDFINGLPYELRVQSDPEDWQAVDKTIAATAAELMSGGDAFDQWIAVFPIAPVNACLAVALLLGVRIQVFEFPQQGSAVKSRTCRWD